MRFTTSGKGLFAPFILSILPLTLASAQSIDEDKIGAWYIYAFNFDAKDSRWGAQGDIQYRNWDTIGDLEQLLIRSGVTYRPESLRGNTPWGMPTSHRKLLVVPPGPYERIASIRKRFSRTGLVSVSMYDIDFGTSSGGLIIRIFERDTAMAYLSRFLSTKPLSTKARGIYPYTTRSSSPGNMIWGWISGSIPMIGIDFTVRLGTACRIA